MTFERPSNNKGIQRLSDGRFERGFYTVKKAFVWLFDGLLLLNLH